MRTNVPSAVPAFPPLIDEPFDPAWDFGTAAQHTVLSHFREVLKWPAEVRRNEDPEPVHQIRVAARRTRTALQTFSTLWPEEEVRDYVKRLAKFAEVFGTARDLDVMLIYLRGKIEAATGERAEAYRWLLERNATLRDEEQPKLEQVLTSCEESGFAAAFVAYFSYHPNDLHVRGVQDG